MYGVAGVAKLGDSVTSSVQLKPHIDTRAVTYGLGSLNYAYFHKR